MAAVPSTPPRDENGDILLSEDGEDEEIRIKYERKIGGEEVALTRADLRRCSIPHESYRAFYVSFEVERAESMRGAVQTRRREGQ